MGFPNVCYWTPRASEVRLCTFWKASLKSSDPKADPCRSFPFPPANEAGFSLTEVTKGNTENRISLAKAHLLSGYIKLQLN